MGKKVFHNLTAILKDKKGNILSIGKNSYFKTHPLMYKLNKKIGIHNPFKVYIHAEIDAIIRCQDISKAYSLEVYRISKNKYLSSKPCILCMTGIKTTPIRYITYVNEENELITEEIR